MQLRNAIDRMTSDNGQVGHAHATLALFADDRHAPQQIVVAGEVMHYLAQKTMIDLVNDLQVPRQDAFVQRDLPGFQRFRH